MQDKHWAQFQCEMELVKEVMKANERHLAQFQNVMNFKRWVWDKHLYQLYNQMGLIEQAMKVKDKHHDKIQKKMNLMKVVGERWCQKRQYRQFSIHGVPHQDKDTKEILYCNFQHCSREKEESPDQQDPCEFGATPKCQSSEIQDRVSG